MSRLEEKRRKNTGCWSKLSMQRCAFKEKDTEKAIREYIAALDVFPTWPEGQFNLTTLAGEKKYYELAVLHMKEYLELTPNSPDAQR
jgi:tetratricopeptide (TPR) repeat protein